MKRLFLAGVLTACTTPSPTTTNLGGVSVVRIRAIYELSMMSDEEKRAFADRAKLRDLQRAQGLRVCEEGEHGTKWREDCMICQCEHGLRTCPAIKCTHAREKMQVKKHPREL